MANWPVYSVPFCIIPSLSSSQELFTVPEGYVYIVRDIEMTQGTTLGLFDMELQLTRVVTGSLWSPIRMSGVNLGVRGAEWHGRTVFNEGDGLNGQVNGGTAALTISGYQLSTT